MNTNPLYMPQRERAGSSTISKFAYQHHWSLFKALQYYKEDIEFILCGEYHDDVLFLLCRDSSKPLNGANILIELNQVKAYKTPMSIPSLVKTTKEKPSSVIGKMIIGVHEKSFEKSVKSLSLVSASGFSKLKTIGDMNLEIINIGDLTEDTAKKIKDKLKIEFDNLQIVYSEETYNKINFVNSTMKEDGMDILLIGEMTKVISHKFNQKNYNIINIYRTLIDDAQKKCIESYDYIEWDEFVKRKGISNFDLDRVKEAHLIRDKESMDLELLNELSIGFIKKQKIRKKIIMHRNFLLDKSKNINESNIYDGIQNMLPNNFDASQEDFTIDDIDRLIKVIPDHLLSLFTDEDHKLATMIYGVEIFIKSL